MGFTAPDNDDISGKGCDPQIKWWIPKKLYRRSPDTLSAHHSQPCISVTLHALFISLGARPASAAVVARAALLILTWPNVVLLRLASATAITNLQSLHAACTIA